MKKIYDLNKELDADGSVSDQELAEAFNCNVNCDLGLTPFDPSSERVGTTPGPNDVYAEVVLDYFEHVQGSGDGTIEGSVFNYHGQIKPKNILLPTELHLKTFTISVARVRLPLMLSK